MYYSEWYGKAILEINLPLLLPTKQDNLEIKILSSLIKDAVIRKAEIVESVSSLFQANVFLQTSNDLDISKIVNTSASISMKYDLDKIRYFSGIIEVASFENIPSMAKDSKDNILYLKIVPTIARLEYSKKYRSFQNKNVKSILQEILKENNIASSTLSLKSCGNNERIFSVQYGESDMHYISRLMEEEGIFYYFEHEEQGDSIHISDTSVSSKKIQTKLEVKATYSTSLINPNSVYNLSFVQTMGSKKVESFSYNESKAEVIGGSSSDSSVHLKIASKEIYDFPFQDKSSGDVCSKLILESENSNIAQLKGESFCPEMNSGHIFEISGSRTSSHNGEFFIVYVKHIINQIADNPETPVYSNTFVSIPARIPFRFKQTHFKNRIYGCQTATVTGVSGEEIFCDESARIKVKFHWDSRTKKDENSSPWIRVAQSWAGNKFGSLVIPRVGMEALVEFVNGDPDQPIVTGCLYNGLQKPPSDYSQKKTISTFYTNSSKDGQGGFNELRFNDQKDAEEIYIHAQKDLNKVVENSVNETINEGSKTIVLESKKDPVKHSLTVKKGDQVVVINEGNQTVTIDKGNQTISLQQGDQKVVLSKGNLTIDVKGSISISATKDINISSDGAINVKSTKNALLESKASIDMKASKDINVSSINYSVKASMEYKANCANYKLQSTAVSQITALTVKVQANAALDITAAGAASLKGGATLALTGSAGVTVTGATIALG